jgi:hypothetical protein
MGKKVGKTRRVAAGAQQPSDDKKSKSLTFRLWPYLHDRLQESADDEGWSVSQEIADRLNRSYLNQDSEFQSLVHGERSKTPMLARLFIGAITATESSMGDPPKQWSEDQETAQEVFSVLVHVLATILLRGVRRATPDDAKLAWAETIKPKQTMSEIKARGVLMAAGLIARRDVDKTTKRAIKKLLLDLAYSIDDSAVGLATPELLKAVALDHGVEAADLPQAAAKLATDVLIESRTSMFDFARFMLAAARSVPPLELGEVAHEDWIRTIDEAIATSVIPSKGSGASRPETKRR